MTRFYKHICKYAKRLWRREDGSVTIEFCILFPAFIVIFVSAVDAGVLTMRQMMLDRAVDVAVRGLRLGMWLPLTRDDLKSQICAHTAIIPNCEESLLVELRRVSTDDWIMPTTSAKCVDRDEDIQPVTTFTAGDSGDMMLVRVCAILDPMFPTTGIGLQLPKDASGGYALVARSAFVNEPN